MLKLPEKPRNRCVDCLRRFMNHAPVRKLREKTSTLAEWFRQKLPGLSSVGATTRNAGRAKLLPSPNFSGGSGLRGSVALPDQRRAAAVVWWRSPRCGDRARVQRAERGALARRDAQPVRCAATARRGWAQRAHPHLSRPSSRAHRVPEWDTKIAAHETLSTNRWSTTIIPFQ